ncbi:MAG: hypothetical protein HZC51_00485 [Nitrospirae bacterium]|nr:hypothetical protein [Nitrospirota bacterium]
MLENSLEEKTGLALKAVREALDYGGPGHDGTCVLYVGDRASRVLLHLVRLARAGAPARVVFVQPPSLPGELLRFADKLRRMYSLDMTCVRPLQGEAGPSFDGLGARCVLSPSDEPPGAGTFYSDAAGLREYRPLAGFSAADLRSYMQIRRLPVCSLDLVDAAATGTEPPDGHAGDLETGGIVERLKSLGYM